MSAPDKCPHCGADRYPDPIKQWVKYQCGSYLTQRTSLCYAHEEIAAVKRELGESKRKEQVLVECAQEIQSKLEKSEARVAELSNAIDTIDLMRDEFQRIRARIVEKGCDETGLGNEILELCTRAMSGITQRIPVIAQRDSSEARLAELEGLKTYTTGDELETMTKITLFVPGSRLNSASYGTPTTLGQAMSGGAK